MVSVTIPMTEEFKAELKKFSWINWSEIAREETRKKIIFEKYLESGKLSDKDWLFCEHIDWHPVDELPLKKEFAQKILRIKKEKPIKVCSLSELFT